MMNMTDMALERYRRVINHKYGPPRAPKAGKYNELFAIGQREEIVGSLGVALCILLFLCCSAK